MTVAPPPMQPVHLDPQIEPPQPLLRFGAGFVVFLAALFQYIGANPLSGGNVDLVNLSTTGNTVNQLGRIGIFAVAVPIFLMNYRPTLALLKVAAPLLVIYLWFAITILWSDYPTITLRRLIGDGLMLFMLFAAVPASGARALLWSLAAALAVVIIFNWVSIALFPDLTDSPIGTRGIYTNKNTAGSISLVACVVLGGACFAATDWRKRAVLFGLWLLTIAFLYMTESKTSQGLAALVSLGFPFVYLLFVSSKTSSVILASAALATVAAAIALLASLDLGREWVLTIIFGDPTLTQRTAIWSALMQNIQMRPMLGAGWAAFWDVGNELNPINAPANAFFRNAALINTAHNGYIDAVLQAGLVALFLKLIVISRLFYVYAGLLVRPDLSLGDRRVLATFTALALALVLNNMTESIIFRAGDPFSLTFQFVYLIGEWTRVNVSQSPSALLFR